MLLDIRTRHFLPPSADGGARSSLYVLRGEGEVAATCGGSGRNQEHGTNGVHVIAAT